MDLIEYVTGNRVTKAMFQIGGVRRDITEEQLPRIRQSLDYYKSIYDKLEKVFLDDKTIRMRTMNVGILKKEDALKLLTCGPSGRASGVPKDVRQDQPYGAYADLGIKAMTPDMVTGTVVGGFAGPSSAVIGVALNGVFVHREEAYPEEFRQAAGRR